MAGGSEAALPAEEPGRSRGRPLDSRMRRALAPTRVAARRVVRRPARTVVVATGVALAIASLVGISSGRLIVRDRVLHRQLAAVPPERQAFRVDDFGLASTVSPSDAG